MFHLQTNEEALQGTCSTRSHPSAKNKTLTNSVPNQFILIAVHVEKTIYRWWKKEVSELRQYVKENQCNWKIPKENVVELEKERHEESEIVSYLGSLLCTHRTYFVVSKTIPEVILEEMEVKQLGAKWRLKASSNEGLRRETVGTVASVSFLGMKVKQILSDI